METLKNYLETMFMNLPNTQEVRRAKDELWQMMEDKYSELIAEGRSENEAVGTVISEFGNLGELAEELGIKAVVNPPQYTAPQQEGASQPPVLQAERRRLTFGEAKTFLKEQERSAFCIALGVMLCILSITPPIIFDAIEMGGGIDGDVFGVSGMFILIAAAVVIFVVNGVQMQKWEYIRKTPCTIDFATSNMVSERRDHYRGIYALLLSVGITLCVISIIPVVILDSVSPVSRLVHLEDLGVVAMFVMVAIGVFMIVLGSCTKGSFERLLALNDTDTLAGNYPVKKKEEYTAPFAEKIMSVFWPTVTCIYLCWSFLTFAWWLTWIIWPIAAVVCGVINALWKK